jgi:hypothetical protein
MKNMGIRRVLLFLTLTSTLVPGPYLRHGGYGDRPAHDHPERGDVPGWVMITLMSAVLVAALLALAGPALETMFNQAMDTVGS